MLRQFLCVIAVMVSAQGQLVQAQQQVKVIYPDGTVRYEPASPAKAPAPAAAPSGTATVTGVSCCAGSSNGGKCTPECARGLNAPRVESVNSVDCPNSRVCKPIEVPVEGELKTETVDEKFYVECKDNEAQVQVPVIEQLTSEVCEFKKIEYTVKCCKITVCVPCQSCVTTTTRCVTKKSTDKHKLRVCLRRDGTYDVYVIGVPGMPKEWLLYLEATKVQIETDLGITI